MEYLVKCLKYQEFKTFWILPKSISLINFIKIKAQSKKLCAWILGLSRTLQLFISYKSEKMGCHSNKRTHTPRHRGLGVLKGGSQVEEVGSTDFFFAFGVWGVGGLCLSCCVWRCKKRRCVKKNNAFKIVFWKKPTHTSAAFLAFLSSHNNCGVFQLYGVTVLFLFCGSHGSNEYYFALWTALWFRRLDPHGST